MVSWNHFALLWVTNCRKVVDPGTLRKTTSNGKVEIAEFFHLIVLTD